MSMTSSVLAVAGCGELTSALAAAAADDFSGSSDWRRRAACSRQIIREISPLLAVEAPCFAHLVVWDKRGLQKLADLVAG